MEIEEKDKINIIFVDVENCGLLIWFMVNDGKWACKIVYSNQLYENRAFI